jgi:hypothetical protein
MSPLSEFLPLSTCSRQALTHSRPARTGAPDHPYYAAIGSFAARLVTCDPVELPPGALMLALREGRPITANGHDARGTRNRPLAGAGAADQE